MVILNKIKITFKGVLVYNNYSVLGISSIVKKDQQRVVVHGFHLIIL